MLRLPPACRHTLIRWEKDRIVLPRVPAPPNLPGEHECAPTSNAIIGVSGLTGSGAQW